jgi:hypothetical protein
MPCRHTGFHSITSRYDRDDGMLVYLRVCERCGATVTEVERVGYRPRFEVAPYGASRREVEYGPAATSLWKATSDDGGGPGDRNRSSEARDVTKPDSGDGHVRVRSFH